MSGLIELHFLPSIEYFCALFPFETIVLEKHEHFNKQSFRNRCYILAANGRERLSIPVTESHGKVMITDLKIDYTYRWQTNFWRTLESAYANAPFFEYFKDDLHKEIFLNQKFLYDLNYHLLSMCLRWLNWNKLITESAGYEKNTSSSSLDLRGLISAKKDFSERGYYHPQPYQQVFGSTFVPNLSLIDVIFCEGPHAASLVARSLKKLNK